MVIDDFSSLVFCSAQVLDSNSSTSSATFVNDYFKVAQLSVSFGIVTNAGSRRKCVKAATLFNCWRIPLIVVPFAIC